MPGFGDNMMENQIRKYLENLMETEFQWEFIRIILNNHLHQFEVYLRHPIPYPYKESILGPACPF